MTPAQSKIREWRESPVSFVRENFSVEPDSWQTEALEVFPSQDPDKLRMALRACVGPGKTACLAWMGWNFLTCYADRGYHPKGVAVSVTRENLKDNLWAEFQHWRQQSRFLLACFEWTKERIFAKDHPETWFISARGWSQSANPEQMAQALAGLHARFVLVLIDESGAIPLAILQKAEQILTSESSLWKKIVQAGNPVSTDGILYAACVTYRHKWYVITITGDPDDPRRSSRINIDTAREQIDLYGRDNPWVMYSILGQFPPTAINTLLGVEEVEAAMCRAGHRGSFEFAQKRLGVDIAFQGDDRTVIFPRQGLIAFQPVVMRTQEPADISARVIQSKLKWASDMEFVDDTGGWGKGVISHMRMAGYTPHAVQFAGKAIDPRYYNKRAEMWDEMARWVKGGGVLPRLPELVAELTTPTYTLKNGKFLIEPKDLVKKRLKRSPDLADALGLTFALPDMPKAQAILPFQMAQQKATFEYDPLQNQ